MHGAFDTRLTFKTTFRFVNSAVLIFSYREYDYSNTGASLINAPGARCYGNMTLPALFIFCSRSFGYLITIRFTQQRSCEKKFSDDMAETKFVGAPFGSNCPRFSRGLETGSGERLGPGVYETDTGAFDDVSIARRASGPGWSRAYETSHMIALPYLLNKEEWERKLELKRGLGPGTYNPKDAECERNFSRGLLDTREPRFRESKISITPGPGTYGKNGVPHTLLEEKTRESVGRVGLLDCGGASGRNLPNLGSRLGPGTYKMTSSVDELIQKRVSTRGPYDVFSADRGKPIKTGHLAHKMSGLGPGQYNLKSFIDEKSTKDQKYKGGFGKAAQYPVPPIDRIIVSNLSLNPRTPSEPGPGHYDAADPNSKRCSYTVSAPPFLSSSERMDRMAIKFFTGNYNPVGAGRYDVEKFETKDVHGCQTAFRSKTTRPSGMRLRVLQERLRPQNLLPQDRMLLVPSDEPKSCRV